jgi:hypothetical protein
VAQSLISLLQELLQLVRRCNNTEFCKYQGEAHASAGSYTDDFQLMNPDLVSTPPGPLYLAK